MGRLPMSRPHKAAESRGGLERQTSAQEEALRIEEAGRLLEIGAAAASDEILDADRRLVVRDVEDVDEELGAEPAEGLLVLGADIELAPRRVRQRHDHALLDPRIGRAV